MFNIVNFTHGNSARQRSIVVVNPEHRLFPLQAEAKSIFAIKFSGMMNQNMNELLINAPVPFFIGISQRATSDFSSDAHVIGFVLRPEQKGHNEVVIISRRLSQ